MNSFIKSCIDIFLSVLPKSKKKIVFESNSDFCDNSRAFYEYLIQNNYNETYKLVWCVKNPEAFSDYKKKNVTFTSFRNKKFVLSYLYHIGTAKTVVYSHATPPFINTNKQTVACLWHGTPLKHMDYKQTGKQPFSFLLSASKWCTTALCDCFHISEDMIKVMGYPRCDQLFEDNDSLERLEIDKNNNKKIILWMPTFRQSCELNIMDSYKTQTGLPLIDTGESLIELNTVLAKQNAFMIIKLHPLQDLQGVDLVSLSNIKMLTNNELDAKKVQLYHLVAKCDILLTDYSSIYFDYLLLDRPIGFIIDDFDVYHEKRGFVVENPLDFMPGHHIKTQLELNSFIQDVVNEKDSYVKDRKKVQSIMNEYTDNQSSKRLADYLHLVYPS